MKTVIINHCISKFSWQVFTFWLPGRSIITLWQKWVCFQAKQKKKNWWLIFRGSVDADAEKVPWTYLCLDRGTIENIKIATLPSCKILQMTANKRVEVNWSHVNDPHCSCSVESDYLTPCGGHFTTCRFISIAEWKAASRPVSTECARMQIAVEGDGEGVGHSVPANISSSSLLFPLAGSLFHVLTHHQCTEMQFFTLVCLLL